MSKWISLLDGISVSIFGSVLAAFFCNVFQKPKRRWIFGFCCTAILLLQGLVYLIWDSEVLRQIYPLVTHLPLILLLCGLTGKLVWPIISVFTAYLCCQLRRWLALLILVLIPGDTVSLDLLQLILTFPLLLLLIQLMKPAVSQLVHQPLSLQVQCGIIPTLYYAFDYFSMVYTTLFADGEPVVVEFMPFMCCAAYLIFVLYSSSQRQKQFHLKQSQKVLESQLIQSVREIDALRESQNTARQYRHDLRHHLQYLSACIQNGQQQHALDYIAGICQQIEHQKVQAYCENEAANLILSAFVSRAEKNGVAINIQGALPAAIKISDSDLCVLLSNALENALHACQALDETQTAAIDVQFYEKSGKLFLQVTNPYAGQIRFENNIPVSHEPGHGIGVQSICTIVQRYGGIYTFTAENRKFTLRLSL